MTEPATLDRTALEALREVPIAEGAKGWPPGVATIAELETAELDAGSDLPLPAMVLREGNLAHNLDTMAAWCREHDALLAPHGKTTMAPQLFARQLTAGAFAITVATGAQLRTCRRFGISRLIVANQLVDPVDLAWLRTELDADPEFEAFVLVDSVQAVALMDRTLSPISRRLPVLIEIGYEGGRCGCRSLAGVDRVALAVARSGSLRLAGFAGYEGLIQGDDTRHTVDRVDAFIERLGQAFAQRAWQCDVERPLISAGGSAFFDRVVNGLASVSADARGSLILRSGCYLTHDHGVYAAAAHRAAASKPSFRAAIEVWGRVLSVPESRRCIIGLGKRDLSFDAGLPRPLAMGPRCPGSEVVPIPDAEVLRLDDQHLHLELPPEQHPPEVGDPVAFGISHPCTTFDRWRVIPVVDGDGRMTTAVHILF